MKYPNGINVVSNNKETNAQYGNRGIHLENDLNISNKYYIDHKKAFIYKKPTPIKIKRVDYPTKVNRVGAITIKEAYFESPSTTDYNGIYRGKYIDFEAKETNNKTSFPLDNIHKHQVEHLKNIISVGGIGFIIVRFNKLGKTYLLLAKDLIEYINNNTKRSIPITYFKEKAYEIEEKYLPRLDYLQIIDQILEVL